MPYKVESKMFSASEFENGPDIQRYLDDREIAGWDLISAVPYHGHAFVTFVFKKIEKTDASKKLEKELANLRETLAKVEGITQAHSDRDVLPHLIDEEYACEDPIKMENPDD